MKRFCLFLALCFLMAMPAARAEDTLDEFLREADSILDRLENQYAMQHLAMDAVSSYMDKHDYASLLRARCVCSDQVMASDIMLQEPLNINFSDAASAELAAMGLEGTLDSLLNITDQDFTFRSSLISFLYDYTYSGFYSAGLESALRQILTAQPVYLTCNAAFLELALNARLLQFEDTERIHAWWEELRERFPTLGATLPAFQTDQSAIEALYASYSLQNETAANGTNEGISRYFEHADQFTAWTRNQAAASLIEDFIPPHSLPVICIVPDAWTGSGGSYLYPDQYGQDSLPSSLTMFVHQVSAEVFHDYSDALSGLTRDSLTGSDAEGWVLSLENGAIELEWNPENFLMVTYDCGAYTMETATFLYVLSLAAS